MANSMQSLGVFSQPGSIDIGDAYAKEHSESHCHERFPTTDSRPRSPASCVHMEVPETCGSSTMHGRPSRAHNSANASTFSPIQKCPSGTLESSSLRTAQKMARTQTL